ncbi:hypothetical protein J42TS3_08640 [Paenibacillus vini]|uniref:Uncharacterized protein n=1 Tax=Paenibacillus vini TaxID=1476024 RepID=A0ABQ4M761_9BACL|nr:hypothetical protein J42TS3_08640 [Paenibacillus vini]
MIILSLAIITVLIVIVLSVFLIQFNQEEKESQYIVNAQSIVYQMSTSIIKASEVSSYYLGFWEHFNESKNGIIIQDNKGKSTNYKNINDLISSRVKYKQPVIEELVDEKNSIYKKLKELNNPPKKFEDAYNLLVEMFQLYSDAIDNAKSPSGSYVSFTQSVENILSNFTKKHEEYNLKY